MTTAAGLQPSTSAAADKQQAQASIVYTAFSAENHWREGNQEGPRRIHACTDLLRQKLLTAADRPDQVPWPSLQSQGPSHRSLCSRLQP